jgi:NADP-dependent 3-hydroxy acid dehydrogenase YdfG
VSLEHFAEHGRRDVIFIGSIASVTPHPTWMAYASSKAGLVMAAECLRQELIEADIRVCLIEMAQTDTELRQRSDIHEGLERRSPMRVVPSRFERLAPDEIARLAVFVLSQPEQLHIGHLMVRPPGAIS